MKIAILDSLEKKEKDAPLLKEAKEIFDKAIYVPINSVKLGIDQELEARFENKNLSNFDVVLPLPTYLKKEFYYTCLRIIEKKVYTPISSDKFFTIWNKPLLLKLFSENRISIRKVFVAAHVSSAKDIIGQLKLPVIITPPSRERILITKEETLKNVLSLFKPGYTITVEKPIKPRSMIWAFVVGSEVIASYEKGERGRRMINLDDKMKKMSIKIRKIVASDFCAINFIKTKTRTLVNEVTLSPDFSLYKHVTGKNVSKILLNYLKTQAEKKAGERTSEAVPT